jgi:hypothetical protein
MRESLMVKATVSFAPAAVGTIARDTTASSSSPRRLAARVSAVVLRGLPERRSGARNNGFIFGSMVRDRNDTDGWGVAPPSLAWPVLIGAEIVADEVDAADTSEVAAAFGSIWFTSFSRPGRGDTTRASLPP